MVTSLTLKIPLNQWVFCCWFQSVFSSVAIVLYVHLFIASCRQWPIWHGLLCGWTQLDMEDKDAIDVFQRQTGGGHQQTQLLMQWWLLTRQFNGCALICGLKYLMCIEGVRSALRRVFTLSTRTFVDKVPLKHETIPIFWWISRLSPTAQKQHPSWLY